MQIAENVKTPLDNLYQVWNETVGHIKSGDVANSDLVSRLAIYLQKCYEIDFESATFVAAHLVAHARSLHKPGADSVSHDVEAVQIEWISNGILVRGKGADGTFCNYYRDTSAFVSQSVGGRAVQFVKNKQPKVGDTCILYFGMSDEASE